MNEYPLGSAVTVRAVVRDADGNVNDPATAQWTLRNPDGSEVTFAGVIAGGGTGRVTGETPATTQLGQHFYMLRTTAPATVAESSFLVVDVQVGDPAPTAPKCPLWVQPEQLGTAAGVVSGDTELRRACIVATELLYVASGRRFCPRSVTIRPHRLNRDCYCNTTLGERTLIAREGYAGCGCSGAAELVIPGGLTAVSSITIDGAVLAPGAYVVLDGRRIVRVDGKPWPCCQPLSTPADSAGSWSVTYTAGEAPPETGVVAAIELAGEIAKFLGGDTTCRLPRRLQTITRQGVTMALVDTQDFLDKGRLGLPMCDYFLTYYGAPTRSGRRARIASPDSVRRAVV